MDIATLYRRMTEPQQLPPLDRSVLYAVGALLLVGCVMVTSASMAIAVQDKQSPFHYLIRYVFAMSVGIGLGVLVYRVPLELWKRAGPWALVLALLALALVFIPHLGVERNNATRWINLGFLTFQTAEAAKFLVILWVAAYAANQASALRQDWLGVIKPLAAIGLLSLVLLKQPDFGSAALIGALVVTLLWLAGASTFRLLTLILLALPFVIHHATAETYRQERLICFLDPYEGDRPRDACYQLVQAQLGISRGGWDGVGLGNGVQKLFFLPEAHTDFIGVVIAEEFGLLGLLSLMALYIVLVGRAFALGERAIDRGQLHAAYLAWGVALWFALQALVSIGVNVGALPTKGLTLPLISSGGSSVMMMLASIGLLLRVSGEVRQPQMDSGRNAARIPVGALSPVTGYGPGGPR
ncbi:MAG: putative lipid II flippase FtsW [Xanthomonadales bacterium]|jgi:cell division protein FtsW|nr:putative lipid II flippase FtsW [Xanthomonadales bacterium]